MFSALCDIESGEVACATSASFAWLFPLVSQA
jgi:hypothetical protein